MIKLDISSLIFFYILLTVIVVLGIWAMSAYRRIKSFPAKETDAIWKCTVCFNIYVDSKNDDISVCPLCGSYNKRSKEDTTYGGRRPT